jgi:hypothetical protein
MCYCVVTALSAVQETGNIVKNVLNDEHNGWRMMYGLLGKDTHTNIMYCLKPGFNGHIKGSMRLISV